MINVYMYMPNVYLYILQHVHIHLNAWHTGTSKLLINTCVCPQIRAYVTQTHTRTPISRIIYTCLTCTRTCAVVSKQLQDKRKTASSILQRESDNIWAADGVPSITGSTTYSHLSCLCVYAYISWRVHIRIFVEAHSVMRTYAEKYITCFNLDVA